MADETAIHWTDSTINPTMGCDGCELWREGRRACYAGRLHGTRGKNNLGFSYDFNKVILVRGRTEAAARWKSLRGLKRDGAPWRDGLPRMIFVSDMSDALSKDVPFEYLLNEVIDVVGSLKGQRHLWQWLTKRPARMAEFARWLEGLGASWPSNLWAGTSITSTKTLPRIAELKDVPARVRFLSVEPQDEDIDLSAHLDGIHWVIQGGESGPNAGRFDVEWADRMCRQCEVAEVAYFLKQLGAVPYEDGKPLKLKDDHGSDWNEWDERLRVRNYPRY